jgi:hypothetical protein
MPVARLLPVDELRALATTIFEIRIQLSEAAEKLPKEDNL